ncbi:response regulator transcription factor [Sutcliffiella rhizosphaerae]|uniref:Transcriptional regulatory protein SrrA n=1 Tax=Sutcliffiella rhizosphaerae TaxID=2880967 RepID=A0ABN8A5Q0_9BACI|nr:response regulator transcription factor [Sutcliffiella rhizosphaerae]CAG9620439.1 Transcriptional regulatory protein SrrA [Sutcliffiella rhizosphaerae]
MSKILIVEDEASIAELERDYLEVHGFESDIAASGEEALELIKTADYRLVLLDLMLPGIDGFEICRAIRGFSDIPILMVTARKEDIDVIKGFDRGADDYIEKPFNPMQLVARVKAHIQRYDRLINSGKAVHEELRIRNLVIQTDARKVYVHSQEKTMTAKEYELLLFLAENPNRVFTKEHLFERIWGLESMGELSTVTVHIRKIREKIEENPSKPEYIETIWGVGYRFRE